jgi:hypothetical protein
MRRQVSNQSSFLMERCSETTKQAAQEDAGLQNASPMLAA